jgi:hypothetical protein
MSGDAYVCTIAPASVDLSKESTKRLIAAVFLFVLSGYACALLHGESTKEPGYTEPPDWTLLQFSSLPEKGDRRITKVRITLRKDVDSSFGTTGIAGPKGVDVSITDPDLLESLEFFLSSALRANPMKGVWAGSGSAYHVGELRITTTEDEFTIGINRAGFMLNVDYFSPHNTFYSPSLAKLVDDAVAIGGQQPFNRTPVDMFNLMSGQAWLDEQKNKYDSHRRRMLEELRAGRK